MAVTFTVQYNHHPGCVESTVGAFVSGYGGTAVLQLGQSSSYEQQYAGEELQAVGEPGQTKRPAERGVNIGQTLWPYQPLRLSQGLVRVDDVETDTTQGQQTWREKQDIEICKIQRQNYYKTNPKNRGDLDDGGNKDITVVILFTHIRSFWSWCFIH